MTDRNRISIRLHDTERDNVIKSWLDIVKKDPAINVSEIVKDHLYKIATGETSSDSAKIIIDAIRAEFAKLPSMLRVQGGEPAPDVTSDDDSDEIARRLLSLPK